MKRAFQYNNKPAIPHGIRVSKTNDVRIQTLRKYA